MVSGGKDETATDAAASGGHLGSGLGAVAILTLTVVKQTSPVQTDAVQLIYTHESLA